VRSRQLETALTEFVEESASRLQADLDAGAEVPFELSARASRGRGTPLYCYRPLTEDFLRERWGALRGLGSRARAATLLESFEGLDRYLLAHEAPVARGGRPTIGPRADRRDGRDRHDRRPATRADGALYALLREIFAEQSDFSVHAERLRGALERLDCSAHASATEVTLLATLHGLTIASPELPLAAGLTIARPEELLGVPDGALTGGTAFTGCTDLASAPDGGGGSEHLLVAFTTEDVDVRGGLARGREVLGELLRALRLFGDGRVTLGRLAWARVGTGSWSAQALSWGGRPHGMLVVSAAQEDELRAFCNLVSRRAPHENELAWALARFEMGCERATDVEALSDNLLALRALLEPEGPASGLLAARVAALCATPEERPRLTRRVVRAIALERATIAGAVAEHAGTVVLARELANHLRALLRDVVCGHLRPDLVAVADELLAAPAATSSATEASAGTTAAHAGALPTAAVSGEQERGYPVQAGEILDVPV
jgi:hypothetical protein